MDRHMKGWSLFCDRQAVAEYIGDVELAEDEKEQLKDPFNGKTILSTTNEKIILFDKATNDHKFVLTNQSIYCIFESHKIERIDLLNVVSVNSTKKNEKESLVSITVHSNSFNHSSHWDTIQSIDNFHNLTFALSMSNHWMRALYWEVIGNRCVTNKFEDFFSKHVMSECELYQFHCFVCKLSMHGIISDTLLLITNQSVYFILLNCNKISHEMSVKHVKWAFPISALTSVMFDELNLKKSNKFVTVLFHLRNTNTNNNELIKNESDECRVLTSKSFKRFAFVDSKQSLKFHSLLQSIYFDLLMRTQKLISIRSKDLKHKTISDTMLKLRKLNPNKTAPKYVRFVRINASDSINININGFVEWSDNRDSLSVDRLSVIGISTDLKFLSQHSLLQSFDTKYFALICEERIIAFICETHQQRKKWIEYVTMSDIPKMTIEDYNFYLYINDETQI